MVDWDSNINFDWLKGGSDERNRLLENLPIIAMFFFMFLIMLPQLPAIIKPYLLMVGLIAAVGVGAVSEWTLKVKASEFQVYKAVIRPTQKTFYFFADQPRIELSSQLIDPKNQIYETPLDLAEPTIIDEDKGKSTRIKVRHQLPWSERMMLLPGYVTYKGYPGLRHNSMANITLWEPKEEKGELDPELMEWVPFYWLAEAPRDWVIMTEPSRFPENNGHETKTTEIEIIEPNGQKLTLTEEAYDKAVEEREYWKKRAMLTSQRISRTSSLARDAVNQTFAAFSRVRDQGKLLLEELIACLHAHTDIQEGAKEYKPFSWPKFTTAAALTIIALGFFALIGVNADFRTLVFANMGVIVVGLVAVVALAYFLRGKVRL